jgi:hypothetical protein
MLKLYLTVHGNIDFFFFPKGNSEPLSTIQHVNNSKPKKLNDKTKKSSPEKSPSDSKMKAKKQDPLQRSLDFFRVKEPNRKEPKCPEKTDNKEPSLEKKMSCTPTKGTKKAMVILDKCPQISPVKVKCHGNKITIESLDSSGESGDNDNNTFEIKSKKFRLTPNVKEKTNAFSLLKSPPKAGTKTPESSTQKKTNKKQKKEKNVQKGGKNEAAKTNGSIRTGSTTMAVNLIHIDSSPAKPKTKVAEKKQKNEKKPEKDGIEKSTEKKPGNTTGTKSKVKSKTPGSSKKSSKKSPGVNKSLSERTKKSKVDDATSIIVVEDSQDKPDMDGVSINRVLWLLHSSER